MKQTLKATAAVIGVMSAVWLLFWVIRAIGCLMIYTTEILEIPM